MTTPSNDPRVPTLVGIWRSIKTVGRGFRVAWRVARRLTLGQAALIGFGVLFLATLIVAGVGDAGPPNPCDTGWEKACDPVYTGCLAGWDAHRNDTLLAYTKSSYMSECVSSTHVIQQYVRDHN